MYCSTSTNFTLVQFFTGPKNRTKRGPPVLFSLLPAMQEDFQQFGQAHFGHDEINSKTVIYTYLLTWTNSAV